MPDPFTQPRWRHVFRAGATFVLFVSLGPQAQSATDPIPNFAPNDQTYWRLDRENGLGDDYLPPASGPGPVTWDRAHPYRPNTGERGDSAGGDPTFRVADLSNPILTPWAIEQMKRANDDVLAGKIPFIARERCLPGGVPNWDLYRRFPTAPIYFLQTPKEVLMIWRSDWQWRHVYLNVPHSVHPKPSWYGESVGHYEGGDTLVVDTIGQNTQTFLDNYRTPHTEQLHVIERFQLIDGGKKMAVKIHVEDPGAFTTPWDAGQQFAREEGKNARNGWDGRLNEQLCTENNTAYPIPHADKPDF